MTEKFDKIRRLFQDYEWQEAILAIDLEHKQMMSLHECASDYLKQRIVEDELILIDLKNKIRTEISELMADLGDL